MATSDLSLEAQIRNLWEIHFFVTPNNFANGPHFVALTQLWATKTWSKQFLDFFWNPECVRISWVRAPKNFPL